MNSAADEIISKHHGDFESVAVRYSPVLFGVALRRLRNVEDAEDAVQDALPDACRRESRPVQASPQERRELRRDARQSQGERRREDEVRRE